MKKKKKLNEINDGHKVLLLHDGVDKIFERLLPPMKVITEMDQVLIEQDDLLYKDFRTIVQDMIFLNSFTLLLMDRLQLTTVYSNRRGDVNITLQNAGIRCKIGEEITTG